MKNAIKRFWGIGLIVIILSSLLVAPASVSGGNYSFRGDSSVPSAANLKLGPAAGFGVYDADQSSDGSVIYLVGEDGAGTDYLYKSTNGGSTWTAVTATGLAAGTWSYIAVAPDNPDILIVGTATPQVYLSTNGGARFSSLGYNTAGGGAITDVDVSPQSGPFRYIAASCTGGLWVWNYGATVPAWSNIVNGGAWAKFKGETANGVVTTVLAADGGDGVAETFAITYVNQAGVAGRTGSVSFAAASPVSTSVAVTLQAGDSSITDITNIAVTASDVASGVFDIISSTSNTVLGTWTVTGAGAGTFTDGAAFASFTDVEAIAFSTTFASDQALVFVTESTNVNVSLNVASFNTRTFNDAVDSTFPRVLEAATGAMVCAKADITLDPAFYLGDEATQIGFVGADITDAGAQVGGIYRTSTYSTGGTPVVYTATQILTASAIRSVTWDGTNIVAAPNTAGPGGAAITIRRSANALSSTNPTFLTSSTAKTPSTGFAPMVLFNGGNVLCLSQGSNGGVAISSDLGKSFNGVALLNTAWTTIVDFWISPDAAVTYLVADDGADINIWRKMDGSWQRINIMAGHTGETWLVRAAAANPDAVVVGYYANPNMYIATDAGEYKWTARSASVNIQDFAVESKDVVYVARNGGDTVIKSTNGAFTWGSGKNTNLSTYGGGNCYSLTLVSEGNLLVGGTTGGVAYSTDSGSTFTGMRNLSSVAANLETMAVASGLEDGDTIYAVGNRAGGTIYKWVIGTNTSSWTGGQAVAGRASGIALSNGVLYVLDAVTPNLYRFVDPTSSTGFTTASDVLAGKAFNNASAFLAGTSINSLQSTGSVQLWAHQAGTFESYSDYLATAADAPVLNFPNDEALIQINSTNGAVNNFVFQWQTPPAPRGPLPITAYQYDIQIYLDAAGTIRVDTAGVVPAAVQATGVVSQSMNAILAPIAGTTYFWRVRVSSTAPVQSLWSEMRSFTTQPMAAAVPVVASPANGATGVSQSPAFSWAPVTSTTKYEFQLSTTPTFGTTVVTDTPSTSATVIPVTIKLEKGKQYFWRVRAVEPVQGDWSSVANFIVAEDAPETSAPVTVTVVPAPTITIPAAPAAPTYTLVPPAEEVIAPTYIWAIIIIGAILVIAVIVLIVRTRRSV